MKPPKENHVTAVYYLFTIAPVNDDGDLINSASASCLAILKLFLSHKNGPIEFKKVKVTQSTKPQAVKENGLYGDIQDSTSKEACVNFHIYAAMG